MCTTNLNRRSDVPDKILKTERWVGMNNMEYRETNNAANIEGLVFL